jgi:hypothetical protein
MCDAVPTKWIPTGQWQDGAIHVVRAPNNQPGTSPPLLPASQPASPSARPSHGQPGNHPDGFHPVPFLGADPASRIDPGRRRAAAPQTRREYSAGSPAKTTGRGRVQRGAPRRRCCLAAVRRARGLQPAHARARGQPGPCPKKTKTNAKLTPHHHRPAAPTPPLLPPPPPIPPQFPTLRRRQGGKGRTEQPAHRTAPLRVTGTGPVAGRHSGALTAARGGAPPPPTEVRGWTTSSRSWRGRSSSPSR